jgi:hypothetical protein
LGIIRGERLAPVGEGETVGGEDGGVAVDEDAGDTEELGDLARVLTASAAKTRQAVPLP